MRTLYLATVANRVMPAPTPRSCKRSSTLRSESGKRTYSITAKRMISGLVLKYLNGECFVIRRGYETARPVSSSFCLTVPLQCVFQHAIIFVRPQTRHAIRASGRGKDASVFVHHPKPETGRAPINGDKGHVAISTYKVALPVSSGFI